MKESPISETWKDTRCERCDSYLNKNGHVIDRHLGPNCSAVEGPNHRFVLTADQIEDLLQKKYQEGVKSVKGTFKQAYQEGELKGRIAENKEAGVDFRLELSHMKRPYEQGRLTEKGLGCYEELTKRAAYHDQRLRDLESQLERKEQ